MKDGGSITPGVGVSVIMPAYNSERTIAESICSVISQTFCDYELIVVDDNSQDSTQEIVAGLSASDKRIRFVTNSRNMGTAGSRNAGVVLALGEWVAFLDSDDLWHPKKLERQLEFAKQTGAAITYTATAYIDKQGRPKKYVLPAEFKLDVKNLLRRNIMTCSSVMVKKEHMQPFPQGYLHEDYATWIYIVRNVGFAYGLGEPLTMYRISDSSKSYNRLRSGMMNFNAYRHVGYSVFMAGCLSVRYAVHSVCKRLKIKFGEAAPKGEPQR